MGQDMPPNTLNGKNCSLWKERGERKSYLLFDNMVSRGGVGKWLIPPLTFLHFPMKNSFLNLPFFFSAENLLQHCFIEKQLETQGVFNFRQIDTAKIIILNNGKLQ